MSWKVLITDHVWPNTDPERKVLEAAGAQVTENVVRAAKKCVVIGRFGVGTDNIAVDTATELGIAVTYVPDYCIDEVSDHVIAMLNTWNRKISIFDQSVKRDGWGHLGLTMRIMRLRGKTIGIVGFGRIGQAVAKKAAAFGMTVLAHDPVISETTAKEHGAQLVDLQELLTLSDFVTLHAPLIPSTHHMIGESELNLMKKEAFLINAARGPLIDENALYKALKNGNIAGAGLDVMEDNVPAKSHPLLQLDNIIITPHTAFFSQESTLELEQRAATEVVNVYQGLMPDNLYNGDVLNHPSPRRKLQS